MTFVSIALSVILSLPFWAVTSAAAAQIVRAENATFSGALRGFRGILGPALGATLAFFFLSSLGILLIVPGLIIAARRSLFIPVLLFEGNSAGPSLDRSARLVRAGGGRTGRVLGLHVATTLLVFLLNYGWGVLVPVSLAGTVVGALLHVIPSVVAAPVSPLCMMFVYLDARVRDEGYDLEVRAAQLAG